MKQTGVGNTITTFATTANNIHLISPIQQGPASVNEPDFSTSAMNSNSLSGIPIPPGGIDHRMVAFLNAQKRLQQQAPNSNTTGHGPRKAGGEADVASFLLQLKTNQNGEQVPMTETEALRMQAEQQAALQAARGLTPHMTSAPGLTPARYPPNAAMSSLGMYGYHGMGAGFLPNGSFAGLAATMGSIPGGPVSAYGAMVPPMPPNPSTGGNILGLNHSVGGPSSSAVKVPRPSQLPPMGSTNTTDPGPAMTDAYVESLICSSSSKSKKEQNNHNETEGGEDEKPKKNYPTDGSISANDDMDIPLVVPKDRDLIPDALFVALGQMKATRLQQSDRVGCYKTRQLGFLGMCCKHCGGQPGFGRYFPNSVRSLAQTTTSQTILKHIGSKCRFCPPDVRKAVLELQRQQAHKEHMTSVGRPRYGSRKIFFQRMWARLHGKSPDGETALVVQSDVTPEIARIEATRAASEETVAHSPPLSGGLKDLSATHSPPSEVSNHNSDNEDAEAAAINCQNKEDGAMEIQLRLNKSNKRKIEDGSENEEEAKKLRISPVEPVAV